MGRPVVTGSRVTVQVRAGGADGFLRRRVFWAEYPNVEGLRELDEGLLVVPALGAVLPLAYALGLAVKVERIDEAFARSADELAAVFGAMYPSFGPGTYSLVGERVTTTSAAMSGSVLLFSGGLDSTSSLLAHGDEVTELFTIWGAAVKTAEVDLWKLLLEKNSTESPVTEGRRWIMCRSNFRDLLDEQRLTRRFADELPGAWWSAVQHGLTHASLAIPAAACHGRGIVYASASGSEFIPLPRWGSHPDIENRIRWSHGHVLLDQYELTRQEKVSQVIAPYLGGGGSLNLAVCWQICRGQNDLNCGHCEKCLRTATPLLLAGVSPSAAGMPVSTGSLAYGQVALSRSRMDAEMRREWMTMQASIPHRLSGVQAEPGVREFLEWLRTAAFTQAPAPASGAISSLARLKSRARDVVKGALQHLPGGARTIRHYVASRCPCDTTSGQVAVPTGGQERPTLGVGELSRRSS